MIDRTPSDSIAVAIHLPLTVPEPSAEGTAALESATAAEKTTPGQGIWFWVLKQLGRGYSSSQCLPPHHTVSLHEIYELESYPRDSDADLGDDIDASIW